jgi:hypothetical protein
MNSQWIEGLNITCEIETLLEENIQWLLQYIFTGKDFSDKTSKAQAMTAKTRPWNYMKLESKQPKERRGNLQHGRTPNKGLLTRVLGPWHSWGRWKVPRLALKPDPLIYDCLFPCLIVSRLAKQLRNFQLLN